MIIRLLVAAQADLDEVVSWYNAQTAGLGSVFLVEAIKSIRLIEQHPFAWHPLMPEIRRCRLARFPYGIIYTADRKDILVLAVAHLHRAPTHWRSRVTSDEK